MDCIAEEVVTQVGVSLSDVQPIVVEPLSDSSRVITELTPDPCQDLHRQLGDEMRPDASSCLIWTRSALGHASRSGTTFWGTWTPSPRAAPW